MKRHIRISDVLCYFRGFILATGEDNTLYQWRIPGHTTLDSDKVAAIRHAVCNYEIVEWKTCNLELTRADINEHIMFTNALLRQHREPRAKEV
jgi:hypothetical protein